MTEFKKKQKIEMMVVLQVEMNVAIIASSFQPIFHIVPLRLFSNSEKDSKVHFIVGSKGELEVESEDQTQLSYVQRIQVSQENMAKRCSRVEPLYCMGYFPKQTIEDSQVNMSLGTFKKLMTSIWENASISRDSELWTLHKLIGINQSVILRLTTGSRFNIWIWIEVKLSNKYVIKITRTTIFRF